MLIISFVDGRVITNPCHVFHFYTTRKVLLLLSQLFWLKFKSTVLLLRRRLLRLDVFLFDQVNYFAFFPQQNWFGPILLDLLSEVIVLGLVDLFFTKFCPDVAH